MGGSSATFVWPSRVRAWHVVTVAGLLFALETVFRYPGERNNDSDSQLRQIAAGIFSDWHPPMMARQWEMLGVFGSGTGPIFVFNMLVYWATFALLAAGCVRLSRPITALTLLAAGLFPTFLMMNVNIVKDVTILLVLLSTAVVFFARAGEDHLSVTARAFAIILLVIGTLVRTNAVFVAAPLLLYIVRPRYLERPLAILVVAILMGLALVPLCTLANRHVLMAHDAGAVRSLELFDLAGIARNSGDLTVLGPKSRVTQQDIASCYTPIMWDPLGWHHRCGWFLAQMGLAPQMNATVDNPSDAIVMRDLARLWRAAIVAHPLAYIEHRLQHFNSATAFVEPWHHTAGEVKPIATGRGLVGRISDQIRYLPLMAPCVILSFGLGLLVLLNLRSVPRTQAVDAARALTLAGILYGLSFLIVGVASDPRYFFLPVLAVIIATVLISADVARLWRDKRVNSTVLSIAPFPLIILIIAVAARMALSSPTPRGSSELHLEPQRPFPVTLLTVLESKS